MAPLRDGLFYGTGDTLVDAVATVLRAAGFDRPRRGTRGHALGRPADEPRRPPPAHRGEAARGNAHESVVNDLRHHLQPGPNYAPSAASSSSTANIIFPLADRTPTPPISAEPRSPVVPGQRSHLAEHPLRRTRRLRRRGPTSPCRAQIRTRALWRPASLIRLCFLLRRGDSQGFELFESGPDPCVDFAWMAVCGTPGLHPSYQSLIHGSVRPPP